MATHHPSRKLLISFAIGQLPLGPSLAVGLHIDTCPDCRRAAATLEHAEGQLLESLPPSPLRPSALQEVLDRIDEQPDASRPASDAAGLQLPEAIASIGLAPPIHLGPDTWVAHLDAPRSGGWRTYVFCGPADVALPEHGHLGDELIVVLEGAFHDERQFTVGDFAENKVGFVHDMQVSSDGRLVALISSAGPIDWSPTDQLIGVLLDI